MWSHLILHSQQSQGIVVGGGGVEFIDTLARYNKEYSGTVTLKTTYHGTLVMYLYKLQPLFLEHS